MGAWIETPALLTAAGQKRVAPYMGAWIETISHAIIFWPISRSLYGSVD